MYHRLRLFILISILAIAAGSLNIGGSSFTAWAAQTGSDDELLARLQQESGGSAQVARHTETGKVRFIGTAPQQPLLRPAGLPATATAEQAARQFLATYGQLFGLKDQAQELVVLRDQTIRDRSFVHFQQRYQGIAVLAGELIVQLDQERNIRSAHGELIPDLALSTTPALDAGAAQQTALAAIAKYYELDQSQLAAGTPELWIYNPELLGGPGLQVSLLTWRLEIRDRRAHMPLRELVLVDAQSGIIALHFNQIAEGRTRSICDDNNVPDSDGDETNNCLPASYVRSEGSEASSVTDVNLAYDFSGATYDYYFNNFGRDSIDDNGMPLISLVRYCPSAASCPFENAFWNGQQMTYGDGFASADDVVGHELTHGVTEYTSGLLYYYQAGAINESMSDVFGELIDLTDGLGNDADEARWEMGEDLPASIGVIRDMQDPTRFNDPDRTGSELYQGGRSDNGGVHTNSGVNNKATALMADGGSFNGYEIRGLGVAKTGQIYYRTNSLLLTSGSDYQDLYYALQIACYSLLGATDINTSDCGEVTKVVSATEMNITPANAAAPEAPFCDAGYPVRIAFSDNLERPDSGRWASAAVSGSANQWYYPQNMAPEPNRLGSSYATSGVNNFWGRDYERQGNYAIAMTGDVLVPANGFMRFRHAYSFETGLLNGFDGGVVEYSIDGGASWNDTGALLTNGYNMQIFNRLGNPLGGQRAFSGLSKGYLSSRVDLRGLAGQPIRFRFRIGSDYLIGGQGWFIDDIRIYGCSAGAETTSLSSSHSMYIPFVGK